ncbi:hypothetical protein MNV49_005580 [Pseudohyphozyma bogoriensis]|nr:hypothetical protein MNV49_005580 [Pseudohyphozyma bogoriensis]
MNFDAPKRRRVDQDYAYVAPSTSRTQAKAIANRSAAEAASRAAAQANGITQPGSATTKESTHIPVLSLATLPPASLQRYLSRYGLLEPHGTLSYHHAVFPVPPLPAAIQPPLVGRSLPKTRGKHLRYADDDLLDPAGGAAVPPPVTTNPLTVANGDGATGSSVNGNGSTLAEGDGAASAANGTTGAGGNRKKRAWQEPKTSEFAELSAYSDPQLVVERLASRAKAHWDKKDTVKEGETLTNFIFALRMRAHTLRATPPG